MPDRCWSVLSAERSAVSIARGIASIRISTVPAGAGSPSSTRSVRPTSRVEAPEKSLRDVEAGDHDRLAAIHRRGEARVRRNGRGRGDVAALAQIFGKHAGDEVVEVETVRSWQVAHGAAFGGALKPRRRFGQRPRRASMPRRFLRSNRSARRSRTGRRSSASTKRHRAGASTSRRLKLCSSSRIRVEVAVPACTTRRRRRG